MGRLFSVALYHRDRFSQGNSRRILHHEAYHWGIMVMSEENCESDCYSFEATDASEIDPVTFRMTNPTMDWWLRVKENFDLVLSDKLIGRIVIGQVPDEIASTDLRNFFARVPLPVKNMDPQQSCVTWAEDAVRALQRQGWVRKFELDPFKDWALSYADERLKGSASKEQSLTHYN